MSRNLINLGNMNHHKDCITYCFEVLLANNCRKLNSQEDPDIKVDSNVGPCMQDSDSDHLGHKTGNFYSQYKLIKRLLKMIDI